MESLENTMELDAMPEYQTIKKVLRAILISGCARGMSTRELCAEYRNIEGQSIDYEQFGFTSLDMFLINMKDTVRWEYGKCFPVKSDESQHVIDLVHGQRAPTPRSLRYRGSADRRKSFQSTYKYEATYPKMNQPRVKFEIRYPPANFYLPQYQQGNGMTGKFDNRGTERKVPFGERVHNQQSIPNNSTPHANAAKFYPQRAKPELRYPPANFDPPQYRQGTSIVAKFDNHLAEKKIPFGKRVHNQQSIPNNSAPHANPVASTVNGQNGKNASEQYNDVKCSNETKTENTSKSDSNRQTAEQVDACLVESNHVDTNEVSTAVNVDTASTKFTIAEQTHSNDIDDSRLEHHLKFGIDMPLGCSDTFELGCLPSNDFAKSFVVGQTMHIFMGQVYSPYKFWFHTEANGALLYDLMTDLNNEYQLNQTETQMYRMKIPPKYLKVGLLCAALYEGTWHRAKIVDIMEYAVMVLYVDYGTVSEVLKDGIRFLSKQFSQLPAMATRGCIDRIRPKEGVWTLPAMNYFTKKMEEYSVGTTLLARITAINREEETVYMDLIDTASVIEINMAHLLIEGNHGYATRKLLNDFKKRHWNEVYPSFDKLENGEYPSLEQILLWQSDNGFNFIENEIRSSLADMYGYETIE